MQVFENNLPITYCFLYLNTYHYYLNKDRKISMNLKCILIRSEFTQVLENCLFELLRDLKLTKLNEKRKDRNTFIKFAVIKYHIIYNVVIVFSNYVDLKKKLVKKYCFPSANVCTQYCTGARCGNCLINDGCAWCKDLVCFYYFILFYLRHTC